METATVDGLVIARLAGIEERLTGLMRKDPHWWWTLRDVDRSWVEEALALLKEARADAATGGPWLGKARRARALCSLADSSMEPLILLCGMLGHEWYAGRCLLCSAGREI